MSRLLFAAARGARIKPPRTYMHSSLRMVDGKAECKLYQHYVDDQGCYIHPDDAHLQYGPVSTELRKMSEDSSWNSSWGRYIARAFADEFSDIFGPATNYPLFYLILAEALADEGM